ncbi:MAG: hypothetical protein AAB791_00980 [Patescibacteria group bacterium]
MKKVLAVVLVVLLGGCASMYQDRPAFGKETSQETKTINAIVVSTESPVNGKSTTITFIDRIGKKKVFDSWSWSVVVISGGVSGERTICFSPSQTRPRLTEESYTVGEDVFVQLKNSFQCDRLCLLDEEIYEALIE